MQDLRMCVHMYVYMCMSLCWVTIKSLSYMYLLHERFHKFLFLLFIIIRVPLRVQTLTPIHAHAHTNKQTRKSVLMKKHYTAVFESSMCACVRTIMSVFLWHHHVNVRWKNEETKDERREARNEHLLPCRSFVSLQGRYNSL